MKRIFAVIIIVIVIIIPSVALGHGLAITQQKIVGDYLIEFEYDATGQVIAGELTAYNFELLTKDTSNQVPYERVLVKFSKQGASRPVFSASLLPVDVLGRKSTQANITLADVGPYIADLSFYRGDEQLAKASFSFDVSVNTNSLPDQRNNIRQYAYAGIFGILVLVIIIQGIRLQKKTSK